ncbi:tRNA (adenosine(37)-N6)-threonylcarbamoyltransferase complex ATPase subunit type 1 TsaE [Candidatus Daviesbacteria bacterium]|nr:tRNA (adenosine(37)-N6)-threonylcarbamoyltransferase complex ATPase subunit type 1 TsaE [Candidatus Daviesbacteria bacterium]
MEVSTNSAQKTQELAFKIAGDLKVGDIIALQGDLGSGKTTFVQGLARALGVTRRVTSPTFVFVKSYPAQINQQPTVLYHIDLYRSQSAHDVASLGLEDIVADPNVVICVEWPEKAPELFQRATIKISFYNISDNIRRIVVDRNI